MDRPSLLADGGDEHEVPDTIGGTQPVRRDGDLFGGHVVDLEAEHENVFCRSARPPHSSNRVTRRMLG